MRNQCFISPSFLTFENIPLSADTGGNSICKMDWYSKAQGQEIDRGWSIPDGQRSQTHAHTQREVWTVFVSSGCRVTNRIEGKGTRARAMNRGIDLSRLDRSFFFSSSSFSPPRRIDSRSLLDSRMHRGRRRGGSPPPDRSRFRHGPAQNDRLFPLARFLLSFRHWTLDRAARTESGKFTAERAMNVLSIIHFLFLRSCNLFLFSLSNFQRTKFLKITFRRMNRSPSI